MQMPNERPQYATFGAFLTAKRREKEVLASAVCEKLGISPGYYSDIEKGRRYPPDREALARIAQTLFLTGEDLATFYDLAGKARSEAPPDLPEYINENQIVRVALRLAKDRGSAADWYDFVLALERKQTAGG
jgi:transcriptional regulator with XRE-family HTH domain